MVTSAVETRSDVSLSVLILGAGGHGRVLLDLLRLLDVPVLGFIDRDASLWGKRIEGVEVIGGDEVVSKHAPETVRLVNGVGSIGDTRPRAAIFARFKEKGYRFATLVHPSAQIARTVVFGEGVQILAGAVVQASASIGDNSILNTLVGVDHDCQVGANVHLSPGVVLCGAARVGEDCHVGPATTVLQGIVIGEATLVGAGSLVLKDVPARSKVYGSPAKAHAT
jgi:UDP-perosamine 4-acetyltransferase